MNIQDFTPFLPSWEEIFKKQKELKFLYEPESQELFENFSIDCFEDQELFKKYCWRINEECIEAEEARYLEEEEHTKEELIDAMNFSIELMLLYGWSEKDYEEVNSYVPCDKNTLTVTEGIRYRLGILANCLKNRQWRRSQYLVDLLIFEKRFKDFISFGYQRLLRAFGSDEAIREAWSLKYKVNLFRIQSNY